MGKRNYSLLGPDAQRAVQTGLAAAQWYHSDVPRREMKALMQRSDTPAIRDAAILFAQWPHLLPLALPCGPAFGRCPFGWLTAFFTDRPWIAAGMNAATEPPSRPLG